MQNGLTKKEDSNSLDDSNSEDKIIFESSSDYCSDKDDLNLFKTKSTGIGLNDSLLKSSMFDNLEYYEIININNCNLSQFLLMAAFLLQFDTTSGINNNIYTILKLYEKSFMMNELEFSYSEFSDFINVLDYVMLHRYYENIIE